MKRTLMILLTVFALIGATAVISFATGTRSAPAPTPTTVRGQSLDLRAGAGQLICDPQSNYYLKCLNRNLTRLRDLIRLWNKCLVTFKVTQYGNPDAHGYIYEDGGNQFKVTALDYTAQGDPFQNFLIWKKTCR